MPHARRFGLRICLLLALALLSSPPLWARDVRVSGLGVRKCSEWNGWKTAQNGEARATAVEWAQGFVAGHNVYSRDGQSNSVVAEAKIIATLLDVFCQKAPEERILTGVIDMVQSLGGTKVNINPKVGNEPTPSLPTPTQPRDPKGPRES